MPPIDGNKVLLVKTGWCERYEGLGLPSLSDPSRADDPVGRYEHLLAGESGHEAFNFRRAPDGRFYGYFRAHDGNVNISRIDRSANGGEVKGVTIIWISRPWNSNGLRVVGWYRNATVLAETVFDGGPWNHPLYADEDNPEGKGAYVCHAPADDVVRLPPEVRADWVLPNSVRSQLRRTQVLQPHTPTGEPASWVSLIDDLLERIESFSSWPPTPREGENDKETTDAFHGQGMMSDPEKRRFVERIAMEHAKRHFRSKGFTVVDVSRNRSFDLECRHGGQKLHVEVKGTGGDGSAIILTEREFHHEPPAGWERALYVLPQITQLEDGEVRVGRPRMIKPFNPERFENRPTHHIISLGE